LGSRNDAPSRVKLSVVPVEERDEERLGCSARTTHEGQRRDHAGDYYLENETACSGIDIHQNSRFVVEFRGPSGKITYDDPARITTLLPYPFNLVTPTGRIAPRHPRTGGNPVIRTLYPYASVRIRGPESAKMAVFGTSAGSGSASSPARDRPRASGDAANGRRARGPVSALTSPNLDMLGTR